MLEWDVNKDGEKVKGQNWTVCWGGVLTRSASWGCAEDYRVGWVWLHVHLRASYSSGCEGTQLWVKLRVSHSQKKYKTKERHKLNKRTHTHTRWSTDTGKGSHVIWRLFEHEFFQMSRLCTYLLSSNIDTFYRSYYMCLVFAWHIIKHWPYLDLCVIAVQSGKKKHFRPNEYKSCSKLSKFWVKVLGHGCRMKTMCLNYAFKILMSIRRSIWLRTMTQVILLLIKDVSEENPPGEPLASVPTLLPRPCPRVPCSDPVSEDVDPECEWLLSFRLPEDLWYQHRSSSETAALPPPPPPPPSRPNDGVRTIWERDGVSLPLPSPPSSPPQASLYSPPAV